MMKWTLILSFLYSSALLSQEIDIYSRPIQTEPSHSFDIIHYKIELDINDVTRSLEGKVAISLRSLDDELEQIEIHAESYQVSQILRDNTELRFTHQNGILDIQFDQSLRYNDSLILHIEYGTDHFEVDPTKYGMGQNYPLGIGFFEKTENHPSLFNAYSFPTGARHWFPCYDHPNDRATHETIITTRADHKVLANGLLIDTQQKSEGRITYHWSQNQPHPTYLYNFVSGPYEIIEDYHRDIPVNYWVYPNDRVRGKRSFHRTPEVLAFFEEYYGVTYSWDKYDQIIVPGIGGGAEATTATLIGEGTLHDAKAEKDYPSHWLVAHEAAHHWWGDFVSYADWTETWLSESFATYSEYLYSNHLYGSDEGAMNLLNKKETYLREAKNNYQRPIVFNQWVYPNQNFDRHTYQKGALVLHMLKDYLGDNIFRRVLNHFLTHHAYEPVRATDFIKSIWEVTGQNMNWFFDQWIFSPGHPILNFQYTWENDHLIIHVEQKQDTSQGVPIFQFPLNIHILSEEGENYKEVWINEKRQIFRFPMRQKPKLVSLDPNHIILKEWEFTKTTSELMLQVKHGSTLDKLWALEQLGQSINNPIVRDFLNEQSKVGSFWAIRKEALSALSKSNVEDHRHVFLDAAQDTNSNVRVLAVQALAKLKKPDLRKTFVRIFEKDDSYKVQAEALRALGKIGSIDDKDLFLQAAQIQSPRNVIKNAATWALEQIQ